MLHLNKLTIGCSAIILTLAVTISSCTKEDQNGENIDVSVYEEVMVPETRVPIYANLNNYMFNQDETPFTRADARLVSLSNLLKKGKTERMKTNDIIFVQTPFKEDGAKAMIAREKSTDGANYTTIKKFLINRTYKGRTIDFVATMIPTPEYEKQTPDFSFNYRPSFSGFVIYSKLNGKAFELRRYSNGRIIQAHFLKNETEAKENSNIMYIYFQSQTAKTRSAEPFPGDPGVCTEDFDWDAYWDKIRKKYETTNDDWWYDYSNTDDTDDHDSGDGGGGGGNSGDNGDKGPLEGEHALRLATNAPDAIILTGAGYYRKGEKVTIGFQYTENVVPPLQPQFKHWSGDLKGAGKPAVTITFSVDRDMEGYAYYDWNDQICITKDGNSAPLKEMSIAPSNINPDLAKPDEWINWIGGTFGKGVRTDENKVKKDHYGLDLAADPGTEIYCMYDGVIESVYTTARKGKIGKEDNNKYGNDIRIKSTLPDGTTITIIYAHLDYDEPLADNPMTGLDYAPGQHVYAGEVIAYSGISGNAYNVPNPHVHVEVRNKYNSPVDPKPYLNGTYSSNYDTLNDTKGKITGTKCE